MSFLGLFNSENKKKEDERERQTREFLENWQELVADTNNLLGMVESFPKEDQKRAAKAALSVIMNNSPTPAGMKNVSALSNKLDGGLLDDTTKWGLTLGAVFMQAVYLAIVFGSQGRPNGPLLGAYIGNFSRVVCIGAGFPRFEYFFDSHGFMEMQSTYKRIHGHLLA